MAKVLKLQLQHESFQWTFRIDFPSDWLVWSPCCPRDSQESSLASQFKSINSSALSLLYHPTLTSMTTGKIITLTVQTLVSKIVPLLFNTLSRFVVTIIFWLLFLCFCIPTLIWLTTIWICPLEFREGQGDWLKLSSYQQEMEDMKRMCIQEGPTGSCCVSTAVAFIQKQKEVPLLSVRGEKDMETEIQIVFAYCTVMSHPSCYWLWLVLFWVRVHKLFTWVLARVRKVHEMSP